MKNITRRGFLQLTAATALVCAAAPLTGCGKKNIKKLVLGDWYMEGYSDWSTQYMMMEAVRFGVGMASENGRL